MHCLQVLGSLAELLQSRELLHGLSSTSLHTSQHAHMRRPYFCAPLCTCQGGGWSATTPELSQANKEAPYSSMDVGDRRFEPTTLIENERMNLASKSLKRTISFDTSNP